MELPRLPDLLLHADWSLHAARRRMVIARLQPDGSYAAEDPLPVPEPRSLIHEQFSTLPPAGCILAGFDFPIGLPIAYAQKVGVDHFPTALRQFGAGAWAHFYTPAVSPADISLWRPFYPARPGQAAHGHLLRALGLDHIDQLRRACELAHPGRRAASPLFWTLGAQQVGKAAISGWRDLLQPALLRGAHPLRLWPFDGPLESLLQPGTVTAAETYPAEFYAPLGIRFSARRRGHPSGKRAPADRLANAPALFAAAGRLRITFSPALARAVSGGFGPLPAGEDSFDALVGLLGMVMVLRGQRSAAPPLPPSITAVEGWIFGQEAGSAYLKL